MYDMVKIDTIAFEIVREGAFKAPTPKSLAVCSFPDRIGLNKTHQLLQEILNIVRKRSAEYALHSSTLVRLLILIIYNAHFLKVIIMEK